MGKRDDMYNLKSILELEEGYFIIEINDFDKSQTKSGKGSTDVQNVLVVAESTL